MKSSPGCGSKQCFFSRPHRWLGLSLHNVSETFVGISRLVEEADRSGNGRSGLRVPASLHGFSSTFPLRQATNAAFFAGIPCWIVDIINYRRCSESNTRRTTPGFVLQLVEWGLLAGLF